MECRGLGFKKYIETHEGVSGIHSHMLSALVIKCDDNAKGHFTRRPRAVTVKI